MCIRDRVQRRARQGALLREGIKVVIAGQPNAGKSSLLNALAGAELAIVTPVAGTTRDVVQQTIQIEGVPLHVADTAGLRDSTDEVEQIGVARAWGQIESADAVLFLHDLTRATPICSTSSVLSRKPAVSATCSGTPWIWMVCETTSRVVPAMALTIASSAPARALSSELLPALGWPAMTTCKPSRSKAPWRAWACLLYTSPSPRDS